MAGMKSNLENASGLRKRRLLFYPTSSTPAFDFQDTTDVEGVIGVAAFAVIPQAKSPSIGRQLSDTD